MLKHSLTLFALLSMGSAALADEHARGEELARTCAACHGADGNETIGGIYPRIAGQYQSYLEHAIREYRAGRRENAIMGAQATNLSDEDITALAAYYARLPGRVGTVRKH